MTQFSPLPLMKAIQWFKTKMVTSMVSMKTYMQIKTTPSFQFNSLKMYKTVLISATAKLKQSWQFQLQAPSENIKPSLPVKITL